MDGGGGGGWWWFPAITLSPPNYSYGCFVVAVVVVVRLLQQQNIFNVMLLCHLLCLIHYNSLNDVPLLQSRFDDTTGQIMKMNLSTQHHPCKILMLVQQNIWT